MYFIYYSGCWGSSSETQLSVCSSNQNSSFCWNKIWSFPFVSFLVSFKTVSGHCHIFFFDLEPLDEIIHFFVFLLPALRAIAQHVLIVCFFIRDIMIKIFGHFLFFVSDSANGSIGLKHFGSWSCYTSLVAASEPFLSNFLKPWLSGYVSFTLIVFPDIILIMIHFDDALYHANILHVLPARHCWSRRTCFWCCIDVAISLGLLMLQFSPSLWMLQFSPSLLTFPAISLRNSPIGMRTRR